VAVVVMASVAAASTAGAQPTSDLVPAQPGTALPGATASLAVEHPIYLSNTTSPRPGGAKATLRPLDVLNKLSADGFNVTAVSSDGERFLAIKSSKDGPSVVVFNGRRHEIAARFEGGRQSSFVDPDFRHAVLCGFTAKGESRVVWLPADGGLEVLDGDVQFVMAGPGNRAVAIRRREPPNQWSLRVLPDARWHGPMSSMPEPGVIAFSPGASRWAYAVKPQAMGLPPGTYVNGFAPADRYDDLPFDAAVLSDDGSLLVRRTARGTLFNKVVVNPQPAIALLLSPDQLSYAFTVGAGQYRRKDAPAGTRPVDVEAVVLNGAMTKRTYYNIQRLQFTPDSRTLSWVARDRDTPDDPTLYITVGRDVVKCPGDVLTAFGPTSEDLVVVAPESAATTLGAIDHRGRRWTVNDLLGPARAWDQALDGPPALVSPDGRNVVVLMKYANGGPIEGAPANFNLASKPVFAENGDLRVVIEVGRGRLNERPTFSVMTVRFNPAGQAAPGKPAKPANAGSPPPPPRPATTRPTRR
jgi:hypothetical protein